MKQLFKSSRHSELFGAVEAKNVGEWAPPPDCKMLAGLLDDKTLLVSFETLQQQQPGGILFDTKMKAGDAQPAFPLYAHKEYPEAPLVLLKMFQISKELGHAPALPNNLVLMLNSTEAVSPLIAVVHQPLLLDDGTEAWPAEPSTRILRTRSAVKKMCQRGGMVCRGKLGQDPA